MQTNSSTVIYTGDAISEAKCDCCNRSSWRYLARLVEDGVVMVQVLVLLLDHDGKRTVVLGLICPRGEIDTVLVCKRLSYDEEDVTIVTEDAAAHFRQIDELIRLNRDEVLESPEAIGYDELADSILNRDQIIMPFLEGVQSRVALLIAGNCPGRDFFGIALLDEEA